jgi:hypothetical protein
MGHSQRNFFAGMPPMELQRCHTGGNCANAQGGIDNPTQLCVHFARSVVADELFGHFTCSFVRGERPTSRPEPRPTRSLAAERSGAGGQGYFSSNFSDALLMQ